MDQNAEREAERGAERAALEAAQAAFDACVDHLVTLKRLYASGADPAYLPDRAAALRDYLEAAVQLRRCRKAWLTSALAVERARAAAGVAPPDARRLRFARWLVRSGRLSDWQPTA